MLRQWNNNGSLFPPNFPIVKGDLRKKAKKIKEELSKFEKNNDYLVSANGHNIISIELKKRLRDIVWGKEITREEGYYFDSRVFFYKEGVDGAPDTLILREIGETDFPKKIRESDSKEVERTCQENLKNHKSRGKREYFTFFIGVTGLLLCVCLVLLRIKLK